MTCAIFTQCRRSSDVSVELAASIFRVTHFVSRGFSYDKEGQMHGLYKKRAKILANQSYGKGNRV
jgi:hypothetical protein